MARAVDGYFANNISATTAAFPLAGGRYAVDALATWNAGSVKLQKIAGDGSTLVSVSSATDFTANGFATVDLPSGKYKLVVATATAASVVIRRIPGE
jgi:hypothetical protein